MKTSFRSLFAAVALAVLGSAAQADRIVERIDHTNGQPTFVYTDRSVGPLQTIGVYENGQSFGAYEPEDRAVRSRSSTHRVKMHHDRGQMVSVPIQSHN